LGAFRRATVMAVGGYDEHDLQWGAEDQELNFRIRRAGGRIRVDPTIRSWYFPRSTPTALWRQYWNYGVCKASTLKKHRRLPYGRPVVPAAMVAAAAGALGYGLVRRRLRPAVLIPLGYATGAAGVALRLGDAPGVAPHRVMTALAVCHWGYGLGFWAGVGRIVTGRPFDARP